MKKPNIVQLNNQYIKDENIKNRYEEEDAQAQSTDGLDFDCYHATFCFANL